MRKLIVFNHVTLDGYFVDANGQFRWGYDGNDDPEYQAFVAENASGDGALVFGRKTYELMASYWPTAVADQHSPAVAAGMNNMSKVVFSKTLNEATWKNTRLVKTGLIAEIRKMKSDSGPGMAILGSGSIVAQLARENLIDEYQMMLDPVVLGRGRTMFEALPEPLKLKLIRSRTFKNGKVYLCYTP
ncbi:MAG TPA: dihydrofolate reductase family protein [Bryobacteraceae bacterium]|nr:dihydrofolate reductase family protein [Bryobacteraceae bacterium]